MSALHAALKTLSPTDFTTVPTDDSLKDFLAETFADAQLLVDSIPIPPPADSALPAGRPRSNTTSSIASNASDISASSARTSPPAADVEALQKEWGRPVKLNPKENPLGMSVYKLAGRDGKGAWFARRSVHEGLGFDKWKLGLEREFPETMKVQGSPGEGNIRGIGGERRVEFKEIPGVGKMEVYHLSAQFPGPTTPRDFVTLLLTSDSALSESCGGASEEREIPRHFMVVSKPCIHPDTPERDGFIRGQYQSVEFIREIPINKPPKRSASTNNLLEKAASANHTRKRSSSSALGREAILRNATQKTQVSSLSETEEHSQSLSPDSALSPASETSSGGRKRGKTVSYSESRASNAKGESWDEPEEDYDGRENNPVEWIMLTRSDPGGSVPRFMVERGTPGSIVADATKFLDWACSIDMDSVEDEVTPEPSEAGDADDHHEHHEHQKHQHHDRSLHDYQTNGHLAGLDGVREEEEPGPMKVPQSAAANGGGMYGMFSGAVSAAGAAMAAHTPTMISSHLPGHVPLSTETSDNPTAFIPARRYSTSSIDTASSVGSFTSALSHKETCDAKDASKAKEVDADTFSTKTGDSTSTRSVGGIGQEKELQRLEDRKRKLDEKLSKARERELSKNQADTEKEKENLAKVAERHQREVAKQEEKYKKEVAKLEAKKAKEEKKAEEKRRKNIERDEKIRVTRELEEIKAERDVLRKERELFRAQIGDLQAENTLLAARLGKMGDTGEKMLKDVREEVSTGGRIRASSIKGMLLPGRSPVVRSNSGLTKETSNLAGDKTLPPPPSFTLEKA